MGITVYTKPNCTNCNKVKTWLSNHGTIFEEAPITAELAAQAKEAGIMQAPIIATSRGIHHGGFQPEQLNTLKGA